MNEDRSGYNARDLARWVLTGDPAGIQPKMFKEIEDRIVQAINIAVRDKQPTETKPVQFCKDCGKPTNSEEESSYGNRCRTCWEKATEPRRFRFPVEKGNHPNGSAARWVHGAYFPLTDLVVSDMGGRGTGVPEQPGIEWLDEEPKP